MKTSAWRWVLVAWFLVGWQSVAWGHARSQSYADWVVSDTGLDMTYRIQAREVTRLAASEPGASLDAILATHLARKIRVEAARGACAPRGSPRPLQAKPGFVRLEWRFDCPQTTRLALTYDAFFDFARHHVHYARFKHHGIIEERLFHDGRRLHQLDLSPASTVAPTGDTTLETLWGYGGLGVEHILIGWDHLAFLLALLLLARRFSQILAWISGFTVGHCITLSLAVLGVVEPDIAAVEALIGLTIALTAAEGVAVVTGAQRSIALGAALLMTLVMAVSASGVLTLSPAFVCGLLLFTVCYLLIGGYRGRVRTLMRPTTTLVFGLIHGFGFASVLGEIGLPTNRFIPALIGFNLGVEAGQIAVVLGLLGLRYLWGRFAPPRAAAIWGWHATSAALCGLGLFWFVSRLAEV